MGWWYGIVEYFLFLCFFSSEGFVSCQRHIFGSLKLSQIGALSPYNKGKLLIRAAGAEPNCATAAAGAAITSFNSHFTAECRL